MPWKDKLYLIPIYKSDRLWEIGIIIFYHYLWITTQICMLITSLIILLETNISRPEGSCSLLMSYRRQKSRNIIRIILGWLLQFTFSLLKICNSYIQNKKSQLFGFLVDHCERANSESKFWGT